MELGTRAVVVGAGGSLSGADSVGCTQHRAFDGASAGIALALEPCPAPPPPTSTANPASTPGPGTPTSPPAVPVPSVPTSTPLDVTPTLMPHPPEVPRAAGGLGIHERASWCPAQALVA